MAQREHGPTLREVWMLSAALCGNTPLVGELLRMGRANLADAAKAARAGGHYDLAARLHMLNADPVFRALITQ